MSKKATKISPAKDLVSSEKASDPEKDLKPLASELEGEAEEGSQESQAPEKKKKEAPKGTPRFKKLNNLNK